MIFLGIDPGKSSGAAILTDQGRLVRSAQVERREADRRAEIVEAALFMARKHDEPLIVVREAWQAGGIRATPAMYTGLGRSWGHWEEQLRLAAPRMPDSAVYAVKPATWRSIVLGGPQRSSEAWESTARKYVAARFGITEVGPDEVVAICLAVYGAKRIERPKRSTWWRE